MARVFAEQGYLRQAARIYRRLLDRSPQRSDIAAQLADVESRIAAQHGPSTRDLALLIREWAALLKKQKRQRQL
jgi:hypothetical protein